MRVFVTKRLSKWAASEEISDAGLHSAAREVVEGRYEADLGGSLYKKRVARRGGGKRDGFRLIVVYRRPHTDRVIIVFGFAKSESANVTKGALDIFRDTVRNFIVGTDMQIEALLAQGDVREVEAGG